MAHVLKYYKELTNKDGSVTRLEIHRDNSDGLAWIAKEIGPVLQQLSLNLQGDTEDIDAPIVKTSLNMTFVDAPDHAQASARKCGDWDEFYTSDSTKWMIVLKAKRPGASSFSTLWSGYLTPDSYSEQLRYRGSVTFVARDNIGHMQDFPFDAEGDADGMISLYELVQAAWAKIESPMELLWRASEWLETGGVEAFNTIMNVSAFEGMNWYEAVEKALYSYGAVLRYIGGNEVMVTTLRYLPSYGGNINSLPRIEPVFVTGAQRELIPAVRRIEESAEYKIEDMIAKPVQVDQFTGETQKFLIQGNSVDFDGVAWPISQKESGQGWCNPDLSLFFNPSAYDFASEQGEDANSMFIACNLYQLESLFSAHYAEYSRYMLPKDVTWRMRVGAPYRIANATLYPSKYVVQECSVVVSVEQEGVTHYLQQSGEWSATKARIKTSLEGTEFYLNIPVSAVFTSGKVLLKVQVHQILTTKADDKNVPYPALVVPVYMTSINASYALCKRNNFNTNYSERNNVILSRDPELAPALNEVPFPEIIRNGIFYRSGGVILPAKKWSWNGSQEQHLALYNHLQLLCYHAKPFNVITGAIVNADLTRVNVIYEWHGAEHILISGSYDYLSGRIEGAVLREFSRYDEMWTGANFPPYEENSSTNVGGGSNGGTSGGAGGGGGSSAPTGDFVTKDQLIAEIGEAYPIYLAQENDEQKEANKAAIAAYVAAEVKPILYPYGETRATAPFSVTTHEMEDGIEAIIQYRVGLAVEPTMGEAYYLITAKVNKDGSVEIQNDAPADYILPTEEYVKEMIGEAYPVYTPLDGQELTEEQKAVNKEAYDALVASYGGSQVPHLYAHDIGKMFPIVPYEVYADEGYAELFLNINAMQTLLSDFGLSGYGLLTLGEHFYLHSDGSVTWVTSGMFISPDIMTMYELANAKNVETRWLYVSLPGGSITATQQNYNKETVEKIANGGNVKLMIWPVYAPVSHVFADGGIVFTVALYNDGALKFGQGSVGPDGTYEYAEYTIGQGGGGITVDSTMSETSTNPVQNKVITKAISDIEERVSNMEDFFGEGANLTLSIKSNQGTDETISAVKATIKYDGQSMESGSGIIGLPAFASIQIIFPDVEGYKTPASISFDTNGHPISYSVTYETEIVNVNLSAWDGASVNGQIVTINGKSYTWDGNDIQHKVAFGVEYWVYASDKSGYVIKGDKFVASQTNRTVSLVYNGVTGSFITIDQNIADSATRVSGDINGEHIQLIRNNSHRYLGKYTSDGTMTLCQLDDGDSHYYSDGSEAVLTGSQGDVFMKLPRFFYTVNERRPDVWSIGFYYGNSAPSNVWVEWDGNDLIGVFKTNDNARSIAVDSTYRLSKDTYSAKASARGKGYSLIKWRHHGIMAVLYFALYGNTNSQAIIGSGIGPANRACGSTSSLGMTDTVASEDAINFWGLENWWGAGYEFFENVTFLYDTWTWKIVEDDGTIRELTARGYSNYLGKCYIGVHLDFVERPDSRVNYSETTGYCDEVSHYMSSANERVVQRGAMTSAYNGVLGMMTQIDSSASNVGNYSGGSRICFRGTIIINNDSTAFKALTAIN